MKYLGTTTAFSIFCGHVDDEIMHKFEKEFDHIEPSRQKSFAF